MANIASTITISLQTLGFGAAAAGLAELGESIKDTAIKMDRMNAMMAAASGSAELAAVNLDFVKRVASDIGVDVLAASESFAKLTASTRNTRLEGKATEELFTSLAAANSKLGGSTADLNGMILAMSQMMSKGKVSMEELRGQLGERLPGAFRLASEAMGMTTQELEAAVGKGTIMAEDLLPKLAKAINDTYNDGKFDTAQANINRLSNEWELFKQDIVDSGWVSDVAKNLAQFIVDVRGTGKDLREETKDWAYYLNPFNLIKEMVPGGKDIREFAVMTGMVKENANELARDIMDIEDQIAQYKGKKSDWAFQQMEKELRKKQYLNRQYWDQYIKDDLAARTAIEERETRAAGVKPTRPTATGGSSRSKDDSALREAERYADQIHNLEIRLQQNILKTAADTTSKKIEQLRLQEIAELNAVDNMVKNYKLKEEDKVKITQLVEQLKANIRQKYSNQAIELERKANERITNFLDKGEIELANLEKNKVKAVELSTRAQIKAYIDRYDAEITAAKAAGLSAERLEKQKAAMVAALQKKGTDDLARVNGSYWDQLKLKIQDTYGTQAELGGRVNGMLADSTLSMAENVMSSFAEMAISGKASWEDLGKSIIKQIEMIIAKLLIMWAVQQLVGLISGAAGGAASANAGASTMGAGATGSISGAITPSFQSGAYAKGGAFSGGMQFFADGGISQSPKFFANGDRVGVMAEGGPEAIMPLTRNRDGKLGVVAMGAERSSKVVIQNINVTVQERKDETSDQQAKTIAKAIESAIDKRISNAIRPGNLLNPTQMQTVW